MAIDGAMLHLLARELDNTLAGAKVDKIHQPSRDELVIILRARSGTHRLLISARATCPRINLTSHSLENPSQPPMLCMLLRKQLCGSRLLRVSQREMDRVLMLSFEGFNELGDRQVLTLIVEIMGRCSNAILVNEKGQIIDALKRVDGALSSQRLILPGLTYLPPPAQDKCNPLVVPAADIASRATEKTQERLDKALLNTIQGISPIISRELAYKTCRSTDARVCELTEEQHERLTVYLERFALLLDQGGTPTMICDTDGRPRDVSVMRVEQYGAGALTREYEDFSSMLENFSSDRDDSERMRLKSHDLLRVLSTASDRVSRRLAVQHKELEQAQQREQLRLYGDLISANIYRMNKGESLCELENFYSAGESVRIALDPRLTPAQNGQAYYKEYRKAQTAEDHLLPLIEKGERELEYIDAVFDNLSRATTNADVAEIRAELTDEGYIRQRRTDSKKTGKKSPNTPALPALHYRSDDGFDIYIGRNNRQNDRLTLKDAGKTDVWLHVLKNPGAHVIIRAGAGEVPPSTIEQAAILAAYHSRARESGTVPVDYTLARYVTKQSGAKPGMVNYTNQRTVYVRPDRELAQRLAVK